MEHGPSNRIADLKEEIGLLQRQKQILQVLISSKATAPKFREQSQRDLGTLLIRIKAAVRELTQLESEP
jgi:hypothetical protein